MLHRTEKLKETPSQTAGPYVAIGMAPNAANFAEIRGVYDTDLGSVMIGPETRGERIEIALHIFDGDGVPVSDGLVELWQGRCRWALRQGWRSAFRNLHRLRAADLQRQK